MKLVRILALAALIVAGTAMAQDTTSDKGKLSYALGWQIGSGLVDRKMDVDINTVVRALQDAYAKRQPAVPAATMQAELKKFDDKMKADVDRQLADNKREADTFLASNRSKTGIQVLPDNVQYRVIEQGSGPQITANSEVTFHVRISLTNGREIRSSFVGDPLKAKVAEMPAMFGTKLISDAMLHMRVGDHWQLFLPPDPSSGNQVFVWEIKILGVK